MDFSTSFDWKSELATTEELGEFFNISRAAIPGVMEKMGVPKRGRKYPMLRVWLALGVDLDTIKDAAVLREPLTPLNEVASRLGESQRTARRRSDGLHRDGPMPAFIDLGPRKRLFFRSEIDAWLKGEPMPFARKQADLDFTPDNKKTSNPGSNMGTARSVATGVSAVTNLFMAPPASD